MPPTISDCWNKCLNFILLPDCFSKKLKHFAHLLSNVQRTVLYFCIVLDIITLFYFCHSNRRQVVHFYLICICLTSRKTEHLFTYHLSIQLCSLPIQMPRPFHYWVVWFPFVNVFVEVVCILTPCRLYALQLFFSLLFCACI